MTQRMLFIGYCLFAIIISYIPLIGLPFIYLATIFHEMSHALTALITGGQVVEFSLAINGSGHVLSRGGSSFLIAISGYLGVSMWAALLFQVGTRNTLARVTIGALIALFSVALILWVNNMMTALILAAVIGLLILILVKTNAKLMTYLSRFIAILVLFNAIKSPLYLIDGRAVGDGAILANITFIPEIVWVVLWCVTGLSVLYYLYQSLSKER